MKKLTTQKKVEVGLLKWGVFCALMLVQQAMHAQQCSINLAVPYILSTYSITASATNLSTLITQISQTEQFLFSALASIEASSPCAPQTITTATTITASGIYCVGFPITGTVTISANNVNLNLNGHRVQNIVISSNANQIAIENGIVDVQGSSVGILVNSGSDGIMISNVIIKNATKGISFNNASNATISNCTLSFNTTGMQLNSSYNIAVQNTIAFENTNAGFDLLSSYTNSFLNCQALATGKNNAVIYNNEVAGFSSYNGYGNIFERCIANGTQALSTTDSNSAIAGFVLRGTEGCTKIINSESSNAIASSNGVTVPYGILLQGTLNGTFSVTGALSGNGGNDIVFSVDWSPDGQYVAIGGLSISDGYQNAGYQFQIFQFNRVTNSLTAVAGALSANFNRESVTSVNWSPDGQYVAIGGGDIKDGYQNVGYQFQIFEFNRPNNGLTAVAGALSANGDFVQSVNWSPDGQYVAIGGFNITDGYGPGDQFQIFQFDRVTNALMPVTGTNAVGDAYSVNWSPDGQYVAIGGDSGSNALGVFQFNRANNNLTPVAGALPGADNVVAVAWSPDGQYLAILQNPDIPSFQIFQFNMSSLTPVAVGTTIFPDGGSISWSPDGNYVAIATEDPPVFQIYQFNRSTNSLTTITGLFSDNLYSVNWSPDGQYVAVGGYSISDNSGNQLQIFTGIQFPSQNVITGNTVYCNGQSVMATFTGAVGVGISGSSIGNMIIGNTAYNNPPVSSNYFVPSNYYFVTNVFNQLFGQVPTELQNISLNGNTPILTPEDIGLIVKQILYESQVVQTQVASLATIQNLASVLANGPCSPITISAATTITASGIYQICNTIAGGIAINASDVDLYLNRMSVQQGITIASAQKNITIANGIVQNSASADGISVGAGCSGISIQNVLISDAQRGLFFNTVADSMVKGCTLTANTTGMQLVSSNNVAVSTTVASGNTHAGFDLITSFTNSFFDCNAYATGQNNTLVTNNFVAGFTSYNGYGNIFERCIANGTQALSTTDSSSVVAGFALRGTEGCTKIINSESANAITSSSGVTIPYGILMQGSFNGLSTVAGSLPSSSGDIAAVNWSPDGLYVAVGGTSIFAGSSNDLQILSFNRLTNSLTTVAGFFVPSQLINSLNWSPDGQYLAVGGSGLGMQLQIFQFNRLNNILTSVAGLFGTNTVESVQWSFDGLYVAVGGSSGIGQRVQVLSFNRVTNTLSAVAGLLNTGTVNSVNWSPDGQYLAIGGSSITDGFGASNQFQIFQFNRSTNSLVAVAGALTGASVVFAINWSPDGQYVAIGGQNISGGFGAFELQIFNFNRSTNNLTAVAGAITTPNIVSGINWSPDGQYFAIAGSVSNFSVVIYSFNRSTNALNLLASALSTILYLGGNGINWSPDGQYIAVGLTPFLTTNNTIQLFSGIQFPSQNVISGNTVYCNGQSVSTTFTGAVGVGISGSSVGNMIIGNTAYDNPPVSSNFFMPSNYYFVTNVFNQLFGQAPTTLQNISLNGNTPILTPLDPGILLKQDIYLATSAIAQLNAIPTFFSEVSLLAQCAPTGISASTTITAAGTYCLTQNLSSGLLINSNNVVLNLNGYQITGTLTISNGNQNVTVRNGFINANGATAGVSVGNGAQSITLRTVFVRNAISGISMLGVNDALIESCSLTQNTTGLLLNGSSAVVCNDVVSYKNSNAGFDLLKSYTNVLNNCQALSTGQGNNALTNNNVIGFSIESGFGNIFENCVANATQALSTTDQASLVAGFALLGTGTQCNKIINCESANTRTGVGGNTIPYGIYLQPNFQGFYVENVSTFTPLTAPTGFFEAEGMDWSPDGQYIASAGFDTTSPSNALIIMKYDRVNQVLAIAATASLSTAIDTFCSRWHPSGSFVAIGGTTNQVSGPLYLDLFYFDGLNETLQFLYETSNVAAVEVNSMAWSPDGRYLATASFGSGFEFQLYKFDPIVRVLKLLQTVSNGGPQLLGVWWSPNGNYICVGSQVGGTIGGSVAGLVVMHFNESGSAAVTVPVPTGFSAVVGTGLEVDDLAWSPDGQYIALAAASGSAVNHVFIYKFSPTTGVTLISSIDTSVIIDQNTIEVRWSPDGRYFIVSSMLSGRTQARIYQFNRDTQQLSIASTLTTVNVNDGAAWSPDGELLLVGLGLGLFNMFHTYTFPSGNVITNNVIYNNTNGIPGTLGVQGVGISGSSVSNTIIKNDTYNNPFNTIFVVNNYNQLFQDSPTYLQNITAVNTNPTLQQADTILLLKQIEAYSRSLYDHFG